MDRRSLEETGGKILTAAERPGEVAEVYLKRTRWRQVIRQGGAARTVSTGLEVGCGIRIFLPDGRSAHTHSSELGPEGIAGAIETARRLAALCPIPAGEITLPTTPPESCPPDVGPPPEDGPAFLEEVEGATHRAGPDVASLPLALCADGVTETWIGNSHGFLGSYVRTLRHVVLGVLCRGAAGVIYNRWAGGPGSIVAEEIGREAALRSALPLQPPSTIRGTVPVLLHPAAASKMVQVLSPWFIGREAAFRVGDRAGSSPFQLIDDGTLPGGIGSAPFDGEGWHTSRKVLVRDGVVELQIAERGDGDSEGRDPFGNRVRGSYREPPRISHTNLFIPGGESSREALFREAEGGVLVLNLEPSSLDTLRSDRFALGFSGCAVGKDGLAGGIRSAILTGDRNGFLKGIRARGADLRFYPLDGSFGSPTLLLEGLTVS